MSENEVNQDKKTILIVDDEKPIVDILVYNLQKEGYNTIEANDGITAVDMALSQKPDLILLDIMLPKMDGLTVCKKIRTNEDNSITPIIVISSNVEKEHRIEVLKECVEHYIKDPIDKEYLYYTIKQIHNFFTNSYINIL